MATSPFCILSLFNLSHMSTITGPKDLFWRGRPTHKLYVLELISSNRYAKNHITEPKDLIEEKIKRVEEFLPKDFYMRYHHSKTDRTLKKTVYFVEVYIPLDGGDFGDHGAMAFSAGIKIGECFSPFRCIFSQIRSYEQYAPVEEDDPEA